MKKIAAVLMPLAVLTCFNAHAADSGFCKSMCDSDQKQCRTEADKYAGFEKHLPVNNDSNKQNITPSFESQGMTTHRKEVQQRKSDRYEACTKQYMQCSSACRNGQ